MPSKNSLSNVLAQLPSLRDLVEDFGDMSVFDYASKNYHGSSDNSPLFLSRKEEFLEIIKKYAEEKFGPEISKKTCESLEQNYSVSTAEHHGPMGHPFWFQSNLLRGLVNPEYAIVNFCTSHVSLGNSSYPRGIVFNSDWENKKIDADYLRLPFFPASQRMDPVFRLNGYTEEDVEKYTLKTLRNYKKSGRIAETTFQKISDFLKSYTLKKEIIACKTYSEQIAMLNYFWWKNLFPDCPDFIPLDSEDMICEILIQHLHNNTILTRIMTDRNLQEYIEQYFNGISCCFDLADKSGTYLFWYLDEKNNRHALWREDDELVSLDGSFRMKMEHAEISYHLKHRHLIPSGLLVYTTLACYYGITCFGGFAQGNYLPKIQAAYHHLTKSMDIEQGENLSSQGAILNENINFVYSCSGGFVTALDMTIGNLSNFSELIEQTKKETIKNSITTMLPEILRCI